MKERLIQVRQQQRSGCLVNDVSEGLASSHVYVVVMDKGGNDCKETDYRLGK